jgi:hypothetical protein
LVAKFASFANSPINYDQTKSTAQIKLEFNVQDRCLGMYFDDPLVKVSAIDRAGNKVQTSFKNNNSQRVFYHFKAPANQFYVEPLTPYLYREKNDSLEVKANGQCGQIYY